MYSIHLAEMFDLFTASSPGCLFATPTFFNQFPLQPVAPTLWPRFPLWLPRWLLVGFLSNSSAAFGALFWLFSVCWTCCLVRLTATLHQQMRSQATDLNYWYLLSHVARVFQRRIIGRFCSRKLGNLPMGGNSKKPKGRPRQLGPGVWRVTLYHWTSGFTRLWERITIELTTDSRRLGIMATLHHGLCQWWWWYHFIMVNIISNNLA